MKASPLLAAGNISVGIGSICAVRDASFSLAPGDRLAVLGRNGVGKSTLLAALAGLHPLMAGAVRCAERELSAWKPEALARLRAWLPQHPEDAFASSVLEAVLVGRHPWMGRFAWEGDEELKIAREALRAMDLSGFEGRNVLTLSGGERQRVALATVLTQTPSLYLLDEPLTHLDLSSQVAVLEHFAGLAARGAAVVIVEHDLNLALSWANRVLLLLGNGEWEEGSCAEIATTGKLSRALGHPLRCLDDRGRSVFLPR
ncbi:ABC transporter ATP-binding protein [Niveibacterium terrae]|uniref:ABC transporter ATP-binding protein n=1 Tax=Niveibacterium terrae TaxID=3373598 RepID=UPI003A8F340E